MGRDWGGFEEREVSSRATWGQGGRDRTTQKEGYQVSKRGSKGESRRESARGVKRGFAPICIVNLYVYIIIV
jgi:hypothetical protein